MPKYDSNSKRDRDQELLAYERDHRGHSLKEIGVNFGISAQRVSAILRKYGVKRR